MTKPDAAVSGLAFSSWISASVTSVSSSSSRFWCVFAETSTNSVSPPQSAGVRPCWASSPRTRFGSAPSLSILLTATITGTPAAFAWSIASTVCGITPSSAATTITAMSVTFAPRARMAVNASWPGVSRKVMVWSSWWTWYAPMCWVMPPASPAATSVSRIASSSEVLPWSTWPMIVITGGRSISSSAESVYSGSGSTSSSAEMMSTFLSKPSAEHLDGLVGERLRQRRHLAELHQLLDHLGGRQLERLGDLLDRRAGADLDGRILLLLGLELRLRLRLEIRLDPLRPAPAPAPSARRLRLLRRARTVTPGSLRVDDDAPAPAAATSGRAAALTCPAAAGRPAGAAAGTLTVAIGGAAGGTAAFGRTARGTASPLATGTGALAGAASAARAALG